MSQPPAEVAGSASGPAPAPRRGPRRRWLLWALLLAVVWAHLQLLDHVLQSRLGEGASNTPAPAPIEVAFVQELTLSAPPVAAPPPRPRQRLPTPQAAASAPEVEPETEPEGPAEAASQPGEPASQALEAEPPAVAQASASEATMAEPSSPAAAAAAPALASAAASAATLAFDWPPSTKLNYVLTGYWRGPLNGHAEVEWLRSGWHYQVRLTVSIPPVFERRLLSDGLIGQQGLMPQRFDQETDIAFRSQRRETIVFEADKVLLANGKQPASLPGIQDAASQFVQMTWLFLNQPDRLRPGSQVDFPLALPRRVGRWRYEVEAPEQLNLPFGEIMAQHLRPDVANSSNPKEASMEIWVAPGLQYLPVKIGLRLDSEEATLELQLRDRPLQAKP